MATTFTQKVLAIVRAIPEGRIRTYKDIAKAAGSPRAYRAVGTIMKNNYDKDVPCHRVIGSDGGMHGYNRGGVAKKRAMLKAEGVTEI